MKIKPILVNNLFIHGKKPLFFSTAKEMINNQTNSFLKQDFLVLQNDISKTLKNLKCFNKIYYESPFICLNEIDFLMKTDKSYEVLFGKLKDYKKQLLEQLKRSYHIPLGELFNIYQFLLIFQQKNDGFIQNFDKLIANRKDRFSFTEEIELLWLNNLREMDQRNTEFIVNLEQKVFKKLMNKEGINLKNRLLKAMISQIKNSYGTPRFYKDSEFENTFLQDFDIENTEKVIDYLKINQNILYHHWIENNLALAYDKEKNIIYEGIDLGEKTQEILIYKKIKMNIWRRDKFEVKRLWLSCNENNLEIMEI